MVTLNDYRGWRNSITHLSIRKNYLNFSNIYTCSMITFNSIIVIKKSSRDVLHFRGFQNSFVILLSSARYITIIYLQNKTAMIRREFGKCNICPVAVLQRQLSVICDERLRDRLVDQLARSGDAIAGGREVRVEAGRARRRGEAQYLARSACSYPHPGQWVTTEKTSPGYT